MLFSERKKESTYFLQLILIDFILIIDFSRQFLHVYKHNSHHKSQNYLLFTYV